MPRPPAAAAPRLPSEPGADEASRRNRFTGLALDRCDQLRSDAEWLGQAWRRGTVLVIDADGQAACAGPQLARFDGASLGDDCARQASFLGCAGEQPWFAVPARTLTDAGLVPAGAWTGLREAASRWSAFDSGLFAYAKALLLWQARAAFCGACGAPAERLRAGHVCRCSSASCGLENYPRTDAAIIVLVTDGDRALLGRQAGWPAGRYSTLAGFVEPGESLEDAVRREVLEEAGIRVGACRYQSSQPWPFPASLMLGFRADAASRDIQMQDELEHAMWIDAEALEAAVRSGELLLSSRISVSFRLIIDWLLEQLGPERTRRLMPDA